MARFNDFFPRDGERFTALTSRGEITDVRSDSRYESAPQAFLYTPTLRIPMREVLELRPA